jgi:cob(I)alamin adenosyltransferase
VPAAKRDTRGLVVVYTGNGKGKTTAALGLALRAAGNGLRVLIIQFIKGRWKTGESQSLKSLAPNVELVRMGRGFTIERLRDKRIPMEQHEEAAAHAFRSAREAVLSGSYEMVVLDELLGSINAGLIQLDDILSLIREKPAALHLVMTGRGAPPELVEAADLVTEMTLVKHPFEQGVPAQRGIEF